MQLYFTFLSLLFALIRIWIFFLRGFEFLIFIKYGTAPGTHEDQGSATNSKNLIGKPVATFVAPENYQCHAASKCNVRVTYSNRGLT